MGNKRMSIFREFSPLERSAKCHVLGKGQQIETEMAKLVGTKMFRIYQPIHQSVRMDICYGEPFNNAGIDKLVSCVDQWRSNDKPTKDNAGIFELRRVVSEHFDD